MRAHDFKLEPLGRRVFENVSAQNVPGYSMGKLDSATQSRAFVYRYFFSG